MAFVGLSPLSHVSLQNFDQIRGPRWILTRAGTVKCPSHSSSPLFRYVYVKTFAVSAAHTCLGVGLIWLLIS